MNRWGAGAVAALVLSAGAGSAAATQVFTNEDDWRAAVGSGFGIETFETYASGTSLTALDSLGIAFGKLTSSDTSFPTVRSQATEAGGLCRSCPMVLVNDDDLAAPGKGAIVILPARSNLTLKGVGYWNSGGSDVTRLTLFDADGAEVAHADSPGTLEFLGIANPARPVVRAEIAAIAPPSGSPDFYFTIDDLQIAAIPEPHAYALWMAGLAALAASAAGRRRREGTRGRRVSTL
ncbi:MAG: hypothetical protein COW56_13605 [Rhodocyclales bacterium CG17_big_fil_post_rev_8_21_14_2_50_68_7]|nr:MAG: hypothetical protein COW56_13605 [Rhodocyclales bacterium CG17_big_fil_post_rev_8_21_14_2_50_68_7]